MENEKDLPLPQKDLPIPSKEIPADTHGNGFLSSKWMKIGIVAVVVLIAGLSAYLLLSNNANQQVACTLEAKLCPDGSSVGRTGPKCEFSPCPTSNATDADETANWKTYTNNKVGFSIKYSAKYTTPALPSGMGDSPTIYATGNEDDNNILFGTETELAYSLEVFPYTGTLSNLPTYRDKYEFSDRPDLSLTPEQLFFDGQNRSTIEVFDKNKNLIDIFFIGKGHGFRLSAGGDNLKLVLSTFKFTDSASVDTSTWKTFDSNSASFSVKYPSNWSEIHMGDTASYAENASLGPGIKSLTEDPNLKVWIQVQKNHGPNGAAPIQTAEEYINSSLKSEKDSPIFNSGKIEEVFVDSAKGFKLTYSYTNGFTTTLIAVDKNDFIYVVSGEDSKEVDQILSTFKFTQ